MNVRRAEPRAIVLGAAAGGGFPQWNCGCALCCLARQGDPRVRPASQVGVAATGDGESWLLIGASPDLRQQLAQTPALWPRTHTRDSPIAGVVLTNADIDAISGLLVLRERQAFAVYAPRLVLDVLAENAVFNVLDPALVQRVEVTPGQAFRAPGGLIVTLLPMPGKIPLYHEAPGTTQAQSGPTFAAKLQAGDRAMIIAPACAEITDDVLAHLRGADVLFFDGTLFTDNEMIVAGLGEKSGARMGHVPISGPNGTLERLSGLPARRILLHINNTNPILMSDSPERRMVEAAGFEVAFDGMEVSL